MIIDTANKRVLQDIPIRGNGSQTARVRCGGDTPDNYYPTAVFSHPTLGDEVTINLDPSNAIPSGWTSTVDSVTGALDITAPDGSVKIKMYVDDYGNLEYGALINQRLPASKKTYSIIITDFGMYDFQKQEDYTVTQPGGTFQLFDFYHDGTPVNCYITPAGSIHIAEMCGGYTFYHKTKVHNVTRAGVTYEFQTGKLFNFGKPLFYAGYNEATKTGSSSAWGTVNMVRLDANNIQVTLSEPSNNWLRNAALPIFIDPTVGYTTIGATSDNAGANNAFVGKLPTMPEAGTLDSIHVALFNYSSQNAKALLYDDSSTNPQALVKAIAGSVPTGAVAFRTYTAAGESLSSGALYWAGYIHDSSAEPYRYWDTDASYDTWGDSTGTYASPPDPFGGAVNGTTRRLSAYITYTASGGGSTKPCFTSLTGAGQL